MGGANLITFTIEGVEYQAEEGMTWAEWCESEYCGKVEGNKIYIYSGCVGYDDGISVYLLIPANAQTYIVGTSVIDPTITDDCFWAIFEDLG